MRANAPKSITLLIAIIVAVLGIIGFFNLVPVLAGYSFWLLLAGFVVLLAGNLFKGL